MKSKKIANTPLNSGLLYHYLIITVAIIITYFQTFFFDFSPLDDVALITNNMKVLENFKNIPQLFSTTVFSEGSSSVFYRPILMLSFMVDANFSSTGAFSFHVSNVIFHIIASLLFLKVLIQFSIHGTNAFLAALLFALHPIQTHTVAWLPGRNDSLLAIFCLASVSSFLIYCKTQKTAGLAGILFFYILALLTKENAIGMPFLFAIIYLFKYRTLNKRQIVMLILSFTAITISWFLIRRKIVNTFIPIDLDNFSQQLYDSFIAIIICIGKLFIPTQQAIMPTNEDASVLFGLLGIAITVISLWYFKNKDRKLISIAILWFFLFISLPIFHAASSTGFHFENRLYIPSIAFFIILASFNHVNQNSIKFPKTVIVILCLFAVIFSVKTMSRSPVYKKQEIFIETVIKETPKNGFGYLMRGNFNNNKIESIQDPILKKNTYERIISDYESAVRFAPKYINNVYNTIGVCYFSLNNYDKAVENYTKAIQINPADNLALANRGMVYKEKNDFNKALDDFNTCLKYYPNDLNAFVQRGSLYRKMGQFDKALEDYNKVLSIDKSNKTAYTNTANVYVDLKEYNKAIELYDYTLKNFGEDAQVYYNRSACFYYLGQYANALKDINRSKEMGYSIDSNYVNAIQFEMKNKRN